jgi:hypothetical protein
MLPKGSGSFQPKNGTRRAIDPELPFDEAPRTSQVRPTPDILVDAQPAAREGPLFYVDASRLASRMIVSRDGTQTINSLSER